MGAGDVDVEPCAVRVAGAHVPVVWAVVAVIVGMGALELPSATRAVALVLGVLDRVKHVGEFRGVAKRCAGFESGLLMWEDENSFAVAALCLMVLVVIAEYAEHGEVESAVAWVVM